MILSILIPTYNRPQELLNAIKSCLDYEGMNIEILVGDDSKESCLDLIAQIPLPSNYEIHYFHRMPALNQNKNVANLILKANGKYSLILHDDDYLLPFALSKLINLIDEQRPNCIIFGKQIIINNDGKQCDSEELNFNYFRRKKFIGVQKDPLNKVLLQQVPSNSFIFPTKIAKNIGYRSFEMVGDACDFDFALRMVLNGGCDLNFIYENISCYRLSETSISRKENYNSIYFKYKIIEELNIDSIAKETYQKIFKSDINILCGYLIRKNKRLELRKIYFSKNYPFKNRFTPRGIFHLLGNFIDINRK